MVGGLWPDDVDGAGFEKYMKAKLGAMGWKVVPSGGYTDGTSDFASIIVKFKAADVDILHAAPIPPDFITFWRQAHQNGFTPKVATISKALLFLSAAAALGNSTLTGMTGQANTMSSALRLLDRKQTLYVEPTTVFSIQYSVDMLFMVLIGGMGTIEGPVLGRWCCSGCRRRCLPTAPGTWSSWAAWPSPPP